STGHTCENNLMPALMQPTIPALPPSLRIKRFLPFPLDTASAVRLLPGFSAMDPVQQAVLHHTLGLQPTAKRKHASCSVCQMRFNSQSQALAHLKGTKHAKKLKALDAPKTKPKGPGVTKDSAHPEITKGGAGSRVPNCSEGTDLLIGCSFVPETSETPATCIDAQAAELPLEPDQVTEPEAQTAAADPETEEEKARRLLYCSLCKVAVNSASQLEAHNSGTKHKTMLEARTGVGSIKSFPRPGVRSKLVTSTKSTGLQNKTFYCETCGVHVNSDTQLKQHISSRRHKDRAAGKPAKHKYGPYAKTPKGPVSTRSSCLSLTSSRLQPLPAQVIPAHLAAMAAAAAAAAIGGSVTHRTNNVASHAASPGGLFQTQSLSAALLRPAPGPIRTSHPQVLFAPY
uniref:Zinc finger protein 385D n=1 Tax=Tetraodon nigroviridis TaxID=99883 RepID=H3D273_TETNG